VGTQEANIKLDLLLDGCRELRISIDQHQERQFSRHYTILADWNKRINLTSIVAPEAVQTLHFLDSLTVANALPAGTLHSGRVLDIGAGAGFPGIPLKIAFPGIKLELIEATTKKVKFLDHLVDHLGLDGVEVRLGRAEDLANNPNLRESFDVVLARGLAKMAALAELTLPFLRPGGLLVAHKKGNIDQELINATKAIKVMGGKPANLQNIGAPGLKDGRVLVVVEKGSPTPVGYPRRAGLPAKQPIGYKR
tara:strand:+ start:549 stop:1301 length:753 start_codon:yes stop_codon:yes gene_type:complete